MKKTFGKARSGLRKALVMSLVFVLAAAMSIGFVSCQNGSGGGSVTEPTQKAGETPTGAPSDTGNPSETSTPAPTPGVPDTLVTVADKGASSYKFVIGDVAGFVDEEVELLSQKLAKKSVNIGVAEEGETPQKSIVVETSVDYYDDEGGILSFEGYRIFVDGSENVHIIGGNLNSTCAAMNCFESMFEADGTLKLAGNYEYNYHPFKTIDGFKVDGVSVEQFKIVSTDDLTAIAAKYIKKLLFTKTGSYIGDESAATHTITFVYGSEDAKAGKVEIKDGNIVVTGNKTIGFYRVFRDFLLDGEGRAEASSGLSFDADYGDFITYEEFGAAGDGKTDDSKAISSAHTSQKSSGSAILAREDAVYYFGKSAKTSKITADVDWSTAHFIIDDSELKGAGSNIFSIPAAGKSSSIKSSIGKVLKGQENIGTTLSAKSLVTLTNDSVKQYIRKGANQDAGASQKEIILVDKDGSVDPSTPVIWDFKTVSSASAIPVDNPVLTVKGGIFTTIANRAESNYTYYNRGIEIQRSNAVIDGTAHYVIGEGDSGAPYNGFLMISNTYNLTVRDTVLTGHMTYYTMGSGGSITPMGTYDCQVTTSIGLNFIRVIQSRDITDLLFWGTFASNYSRNITFDGCVISRFDAHKSVCNVTLKNSTFGHQGINLIGHGTALIENCNIYARNIINLRDDYGSTWDGDVVIKNCCYYPYGGASSCDPALIGGTNTYDWNFGYTCCLPKNITIDGLYVNDAKTLTGEAPMLYANINTNYNSDSYKGKYPMVMTESVKVKGFESFSGKNLGVSTNMFMFKDLSITFE
ncbi:MAG: hypothetical protein K6B54_06625 [Clostridia bacterium]|nr:hypothetical protein [Clostridia bacterium]